MHKYKNLNVHINITIESKNAYFYEDVFLCEIACDPNSSKITYDEMEN